ncbi:hypothetical protein [Duganella radicis]|uniref:O-antigen ligase domain-containing protein n=1 Tax=Duganella radicis TaxID=551988 RepID=A0A6L6PSX2_9BURK|nr:hypothetical protein [Duganella radicis]MTV41909.1 hypothetical protein [Duganella radicis]
MKLPFFRRSRLAAPTPFQLSRARPAARGGLSWLFLLPVLLVSLFVGLIGGLDSPALLLIVVGAVFALLLFVMANLYGLITILFVAAFLVQGSALYFVRMKAAVWVAVGFAIMFLARTLLELLLRRRPRGEDIPRPEGGGVLLAAALYVLCFGISGVINRVPTGQLLSAFKSTLPMFGVLLALYWIRWQPQQLEKLWRLLVVVALIQLPVVLYQHFFIADGRTYDSIVGTFGGTPGFGGNSAGMVIFMLGMLVYALARWDRGLLSLPRMLAVAAVVLAVVLLGEVKAAFIWLPAVTFWVLRKRIMKNLLFMVGYAMLIMVFMASTYAVYKALYWGKNFNKGHTVAEELDARGGYFFDPRSINYKTGEVSRGASLAIWFNDKGSSLPKRLVGFGPGASKPAGGVVSAGEVARRYAPLSIDATALAILLWDEGVLGALAYVALLLAALRLGWKVTKNKQLDPGRQAIAETCVPLLALLLSTLIYNRGLVEECTAELLLMFCIGSIVQIARYSGAAATVAAAPETAPPLAAPAVKSGLARPLHAA